MSKCKKGRSRAQFEQEFFQMFYWSRLQLTLPKRLFDGHAIENVRLFQSLLCEVWLRGRQEFVKIGYSLALPRIGVAVDLQGKYIPVPAVFNTGYGTSLSFLNSWL